MTGSTSVRLLPALLVLLAVPACSFSVSLSHGEAGAHHPPSSPLSSPSSTPVEGTGVVEISFPAGGSAATVRGTAAQGQHRRYVFVARAGQSAQLVLTSDGDRAAYGLTSPSGRPLQRAVSEVRQGSYALPETGRYEITIASPRAGTAYELTVRIPPS